MFFLINSCGIKEEKEEVCRVPEKGEEDPKKKNICEEGNAFVDTQIQKSISLGQNRDLLQDSRSSVQRYPRRLKMNSFGLYYLADEGIF